MALSDEKMEEIYRTTMATHAKILEYEKRGCSKAMDGITKVSDDLEKNTREHIWIKGCAYTTMLFTTVMAYVISIVWKKHGG